MTKEVDEIFKKYGKKLSDEIRSDEPIGNFSKEYATFKKEISPDLSRFEKLCKGLGTIIKVNPSQKDSEGLKKRIADARLDVTPSEVASLAIVALFLIFFIGVLISVVSFMVTGAFPLILLGLSLMISLFSFYLLYTTPTRLANQYRLKTASQMVPCILYIVAYMKHTSNLERAVAFASRHLSPPLSLDLKKVFWDLETGKYSTLKESLENYLGTWRETNIEFVEAFHLIESSLYEPGEDRRVAVLERALQVALDGVYERMLKYSHDIRGPLTNLYMLGIILPTLAIALLPLASTLLGGVLQWYHVFLLFDILIPFFVFYITNDILSKRPGGYGESEILELNPDYNKFTDKKPYIIAFLICFPLFLIGLLPFILQLPFFDNTTFQDPTFGQLGLPFQNFQDLKVFDFKIESGKLLGPFGPGALLLSLFIPLSIALFFSIVYLRKTSTLIKARETSKKLEDEFASSLFQLGNRLGDGMPAEMAFAHVAQSVKGQITEGFFSMVNTNMQQLGMSLEEAIYNKRRGAIIYYPSALIATSMKILVESVKKGLQIASRSLMSISEYVKNIRKIEERLRDLLAEITSDMKSNMTFLAPLLAGIVVGLAGMITLILSKLQAMIATAGSEETIGIGNAADLLKVFDLNAMIPPYFLQIAIGIYIIEIIFILSSTLVTIDSGADKLKIVNETGINLKRGVILYLIVALLSTLALSLLAGVALGGMAA